MSLTLPESFCRFIAFACAPIMFLACSGPARDTVYIYNPSKKAITITIDNEPVAVPADSMIRKSIDIGMHSAKYKDRVDSLHVTGNTNILINPIREKLIKSEMLYQTEYIQNGKASEEDYKTPLATIIVDSLRYGGHFTVTDDVII